MHLSTRGRYAVMALVDLAGREAASPGKRPVTLAEIAASQQLSLSYLEQLFGKLRRGGLVASARGPGGGYRLARPAQTIAIAEIVSAVDEQIRATRCFDGGPGCMANKSRCQTHELWAALGQQIQYFLVGISLADVIDRRVVGRAMALQTTKLAAE